MSTEPSTLKNEVEKQEKINIDLSKKISPKKSILNPANDNCTTGNKSNVSIFSGENAGFDIDKYFQDQESFLNYQDSFPHEDLDILLNTNSLHSNDPQKSPTLSSKNNKSIENSIQTPSIIDKESSELKEKNNLNENEKIENLMKNKDLKKRGRPRLSPEKTENIKENMRNDDTNNSLIGKDLQERNNIEKQIIDFQEKNQNDKHVKELTEKSHEIETAKIDIEKSKTNETSEKECKIRESYRKLDNDKRSVNSDSVPSNDNVLIIETYAQNQNDRQSPHHNHKQPNYVYRKPEVIQSVQPMKYYQYDMPNYSPTKINQSANMIVSNNREQQNLKPTYNYNLPNQYYDKFNYDDQYQDQPTGYEPNYYKPDYYNQPLLPYNYEQNDIKMNTYPSPPIRDINIEPKPLLIRDDNSEFERKLSMFDQGYSDLLPNKQMPQSNYYHNSPSSTYVPAENPQIYQNSPIRQSSIGQQSPFQSKLVQSNTIQRMHNITSSPQTFPPQPSSFSLQLSSSNQMPNMLLNESFQSQIDMQNKVQQNIEELVLSKAVYEPSFIRDALTNDDLIINPFQLKFEPQSFWMDVHENFTFGSLIKKFFRLKNTRISKFIYKLYDLLLITSKLPYYKGIVGVNWVTFRIFTINIEFFASLIDIAYSSIESTLFGPNGYFTVLGFAEVTPQNFHEAGLGSFPDIPEPNIKLMFHLDQKFINKELSTQVLDDIENRYRMKIHTPFNNMISRPKYPAFSY